MPCPMTLQANLPACSPQPPINAQRQAGKLWIPFFKVCCYDWTKGMNPRSTDCEADALTTTPSRRSQNGRLLSGSIVTTVGTDDSSIYSVTEHDFFLENMLSLILSEFKISSQIFFVCISLA